MSTAWAHNPVHGSAMVTSSQSSDLQLTKSEAEPGDKGQGGAEGGDDSTTKEPDSNDEVPLSKTRPISLLTLISGLRSRLPTS